MQGKFPPEKGLLPPPPQINLSSPPRHSNKIICILLICQKILSKKERFVNFVLKNKSACVFVISSIQVASRLSSVSLSGPYIHTLKAIT